MRRELEALGQQFRTTGDTEVVIAAIAQWGVEAAVRKFIGMFAFALWDRYREAAPADPRSPRGKAALLRLARRTLCFGSELKALRAYGHWKPEIDRTALAEYFQFGYINAPRSIYRDVFKLPPGHWLELAEGGEPVVRRYWSVLDALGEPLAGEEDELAEQLEGLMIDAFKLRMVSDVPVGMFLSGGIDSSVVTAVLRRHYGNVHTFTIGFTDAKYDESAHARRVAEHLGTEHTERILETGEAQRILPQWAELYDEPFADSSGIPTYLVSKMASEQVKVVLSADGGDELFSGYNSYESMLNLLSRRSRIPRPVRLAARAALNVLPLDALDAMVLAGPMPTGAKHIARQYFTRRARRARDYYLNDGTDGALYETHVSSYWGPRFLPSLLGSPAPRMRELPDSYPGSFPEKMCLWDLHNFLSGDVLAKVDRATMAASIEGREPLIDHRLVEFAFRLPLHLRRGALGSKHLLRKILYKYVPREMVDRPKMGFTIPLFEWLRGDLFHLVREHLDPVGDPQPGPARPGRRRPRGQGAAHGRPGRDEPGLVAGRVPALAPTLGLALAHRLRHLGPHLRRRGNPAHRSQQGTREARTRGLDLHADGAQPAAPRAGGKQRHRDRRPEAAQARPARRVAFAPPSQARRRGRRSGFPLRRQRLCGAGGDGHRHPRARLGAQ